MKMKNKLAQVWIETVLYTLIGLTIIGITLAFAMPKINEARDRSLVEQSVESLSDIDKKFDAVIENGPGNLRNFEVLVRQGEFIVDSDLDLVSIKVRDLGTEYSESGLPINFGRLILLTEETQTGYDVTVTLPYSNLVNITYNNVDLTSESFSQSSIPYKFSVENLGKVGGGPKNVVNLIKTG